MVGDSVPVQILLGIYLGMLTGVLPALVAFSLGLVFKYFTGVTIPGFGVVVLGVAVAGINGGLLALNDPTIRQSANAVTLITGIVVVLMATLYAHNLGDKLGASLPKRVSWRSLRERTLSADVVELVGGRGQVRVEIVGQVESMEGYPPLPSDVATAIQEGDWTLPADLSLPDLEARFAERLRTELDLADVVVSIDEKGRASVAAAPALSGLSKRVPTGERAVSVEALVPTGLARGDEVELHLDDETVTGTIVSAKSGDGKDKEKKPASAPDATDAEAPARAAPAPTTTGGEGRLTVAVDRSDATTLLGADRARAVVNARGKRREFELLSLLRRAGKRFRRITVRAGGALDGTTLREATVRETYGVAVLAVRRPDGWQVAPRGDTELTAEDELFAVGSRDSLATFAEAVA